MSNIAIRTENLGKRYRIGQIASYGNLRESLTNALSAPFRRGRARAESANIDYIWALKNISLEVEEGEVLGIIGRNGAGKTTLLKILTRVTTPTEGFAEVSGRVSSLLEVGTGFHPELTGRENVLLNGAILGMKKKEIDRKFDEIVAFSGVEKFMNTPLKRYSSGMQVRLAFAVAAHLEPDILLIDEVLAVGDYEFQQKCFGKMREVGKQGRTVLVVSHQLNNISSLCSRTMLLDKGQVVMSGETSKVIEHYVSTSRQSAGKVVWDDPQTAPGNEKIKLHSVCTLSPDGKVSGELDVHSEIVLQVSYWNLQEGQKPIVSFAIRGPMDEIVCFSSSIPEENITEDDSHGAIGLYEAECRFPARFFNTLTYSVDLSLQLKLVQRQPEDIVERSILSFTVFSLSQKDTTWLTFPGSVHPLLSWRIKALGK
jgi:lipopolysaccharide transport system ATP-binding protein